MVKSLLGQAIKSLFIDAILEIVYFPVWWYSAGLKKTILSSLNGIKNANNNLYAPKLMKTLFFATKSFTKCLKIGRLASKNLKNTVCCVIYIFILLKNWIPDNMLSSSKIV